MVNQKQTTNNTNKKLSPEYIAGYVDGEGCFGLQFRKDVRHERLGSPVYYSWKAQFMITARKDEIDLFERIKYFFGCGKIYNQKKNGLKHIDIAIHHQFHSDPDKK